jgi:hypothetical protein
MKRPCMTIGRLMIAILVIALNAGLIRAFFIQAMFTGLILLFFAMQVGLFFLLRSQGRGRHFWVGFEIAGFVTVVALFGCELLPNSALGRCASSYETFCMDTVVESPQIPEPFADFLMKNPDLLDAVVFFAPELLTASLGGIVAVLVTHGLRRRRSIPNRSPSHCSLSSDVVI